MPHACPTYRGEIYDAEIDRLADIATELRLEHFLLDIEYIDGSPGRTGGCLRCNAYVEQSGLPPREAMLQAGSEIIRDVRNAVNEAWPADAGDPPLIGVYHTLPGGFAYIDLFDYDALHAEGSVDFAMPVYYGGEPPDALGRNLRELRKKTPGGFLFPWHQPGSVIEYPSPWVYDRVLENFGSGARGLAWYTFSPMEGEDFYHAAKAMTAVRSVETVLSDAEPAAVTQDAEAAGVRVTALRRGDDYVLLLSAYDAPEEATGASVTIRLPSSATGKVWNLSSGETAGEVAGQRVELRWEPGTAGAHTNLYYVGDKQVTLPDP